MDTLSVADAIALRDRDRDGDPVLGEGGPAECKQAKHQTKREQDGNEFTQFHVFYLREVRFFSLLFPRCGLPHQRFPE